jgi:hypothetical protein
MNYNKTLLKQNFIVLYTACASDIILYLTPLGQVMQFIETCGTKNPFVKGNLFTFGLVC